MRKRQAEKYATEVGTKALERQEAERKAGRCDYCLAAPGAPHHGLCPNHPEDEDAAPPTQEEALFS